MVALLWESSKTNLADFLHLSFIDMFSFWKIILSETFIFIGCKKPAQMLSLLVYVAAEIGAQQFIEIILTSSAGRVFFVQ